MVGAAAPLLGVVADPGPLGVAVEHEHDRVQIEGQAAARLRAREERLPELVVQADELPDVPGAQPAEEPPQGGLIGEAGQPRNLLEGAIVLQDLGRVDAVEPDDDGVDERQQQLGRLVVAGARGRAETALQQPLEAELLAERVDQGHPGEVRQPGLLERDRQISEAFRHWTKSYFLSRFLSRAKNAFRSPSCGPNASRLRSNYASMRFIHYTMPV